MATVTMESILAAIMQQNDRFDKVEKVFEPIIGRMGKLEQAHAFLQHAVEQTFETYEETSARRLAEVEARINDIACSQSDASQCGSAKRARSEPCASDARSSLSATSSPPSARAADGNIVKIGTSKLHISTHGQARIAREALKPAIAAVAEDADLANCYEIIGPNFGCSWTLLFIGDVRAAELRSRQFCAALREGEGGQWREIIALSPRAAEGPIKIYITPDRSPERRTKEFQWRMLKQALREIKEQEWQFENRGKVASVAFFPIAQLGYDYISKENKIAWFDSPRPLEIISKSERVLVAKKYEILLSRGPLRG